MGNSNLIFSIILEITLENVIGSGRVQADGALYSVEATYELCIEQSLSDADHLVTGHITTSDWMYVTTHQGQRLTLTLENGRGLRFSFVNQLGEIRFLEWT